MTAVISTTYDDKYLFFWPIVAYCWDKLGVGTICFAPQPTDRNEKRNQKMTLIADTLIRLNLKSEYQFYKFNCPEHKEATYAQCSRLFAACIPALNEKEQVIISDVDMAFFSKDYIHPASWAIIDVYGADLVSKNQVPMCYLSGTVQTWRALIGDNKTYQECLDELVGIIECEDFRGCQWALDQDTAWKMLNQSEQVDYINHNRAKDGTQFAMRRYDRDDAYILERLSSDTIDFHLNRPGYEEKNFETIMTIFKYHYPEENLDWMKHYRDEYIKLL